MKTGMMVTMNPYPQDWRPEEIEGEEEPYDQQAIEDMELIESTSIVCLEILNIYKLTRYINPNKLLNFLATFQLELASNKLLMKSFLRVLKTLNSNSNYSQPSGCLQVNMMILGKCFEIMERGMYLKEYMHHFVRVQMQIRRFQYTNDSYLLKCVSKLKKVTPFTYFEIIRELMKNNSIETEGREYVLEKIKNNTIEFVRIAAQNEPPFANKIDRGGVMLTNLVKVLMGYSNMTKAPLKNYFMTILEHESFGQHFVTLALENSSSCLVEKWLRYLTSKPGNYMNCTKILEKIFKEHVFHLQSIGLARLLDENHCFAEYWGGFILSLHQKQFLEDCFLSSNAGMRIFHKLALCVNFPGTSFIDLINQINYSIRLQENSHDELIVGMASELLKQNINPMDYDYVRMNTLHFLNL